MIELNTEKKTEKPIITECESTDFSSHDNQVEQNGVTVEVYQKPQLKQIDEEQEGDFWCD